MKADFSTCIFIVAVFSVLLGASKQGGKEESDSTKTSDNKSNYGSKAFTTTCSDRNPYFDHFRITVKKLDQPSTDKTSGKCLGEWNVFGTCCPVKDVVEHAELDKSKIDAAVDSVKKQLAQLKISLSELREYLLHELYMPNTTISTIENARKAVQELFDQQLFEDYFGNLVDMTDGDLALFNASLTTCWQQIVKSRAAAICGTCSGRSSYFFKNSKGLISQEFCNEIMAQCATTLPTLLEILIGLYKAEPLLQKLSVDTRFGLRTSLSYNFKSNSVNGYYSQLLKNEAIENDLDNHNNPDTVIKENSLRKLCFHFLQLSRSTIIEHISDIFTGTIQSVLTVEPTINEHVKKNEKQIKEKVEHHKREHPHGRPKGKTISNSKPKPPPKMPRLLTQSLVSNSLPELLTGDVSTIVINQILVTETVVAAQIDSSYTSYIGAIGTTNHGHSSMALNLTHHFP